MENLIPPLGYRSRYPAQSNPNSLNLMFFMSLFIDEPMDWATLTNSIAALTKNTASEVRYVASTEELSDDESIVDIVVMELRGQSDYALEIYWKGMNKLAKDAVAMHISTALNSPVIISTGDLPPFSWLRLCPNGMIETINLNTEKLGKDSTVSYTIEGQ